MSERTHAPVKVTYVIGNGLDLALGLKTGYKDFSTFFIQYLSRLSRKSKRLRDEANWLREKVEEDESAFWHDAELFFGRLPFSDFRARDKRRGDVCGIVQFCHEHLQRAINEWLIEQLKNFKIPNDKAAEIRELFIRRLICSCLEYGIDVSTQKFCLDTMEKHGLDIRIVTFNYTDTIEQLLDCNLEETEVVIPSIGHRVYTINVKLSEIAFVHGKLGGHAMYGKVDGENSFRRLVFGVEDEHQICDEKARTNVECLARLGKYTYKAYFQDVERRLRDAIKWMGTSNVIVTFGHSFGETDLHWWREIYNCLSQKKCYLVGLEYYDKNEARKFNGDAILYKQRFLRRIFRSLTEEQVRNSQLANIAQKVHCVPPMNIKEPDGSIAYCDYLNLRYIGQLCLQ